MEKLQPLIHIFMEKNDKGKLESYLISYNSKKSGNITVYLKGYVNANYNDDKL